MAHLSNAHKQCFYFPRPMMKEIRAEAERLGRPFAWVVRKAVGFALPRIAAFDPDRVSR